MGGLTFRLEGETPDAHDRIADELVDICMMLREGFDHLVEVVAELKGKRRGRHSQTGRCEPPDIGEKHDALDLAWPP